MRFDNTFQIAYVYLCKAKYLSFLLYSKVFILHFLLQMKDMPLFLLNRPFLLLKILRTEASLPL